MTPSSAAPRSGVDDAAGRRHPAPAAAAQHRDRAAVVSVALATLAIYFLRKIAPVVSLSVVYLPAVLLVATYWGMAPGSAHRRC